MKKMLLPVLITGTLLSLTALRTNAQVIVHAGVVVHPLLRPVVVVVHPAVAVRPVVRAAVVVRPVLRPPVVVVRPAIRPAVVVVRPRPVIVRRVVTVY
jgi:hypothetical protein